MRTHYHGHLSPIELVLSKKFSAAELREIRILIEENLQVLENRWDEHFN